VRAPATRRIRGGPQPHAALAAIVGAMAFFQPGTIAAGCEVVGLLGEGAQAQVYEVIDSRGIRRALKWIKTGDVQLAAKVRERFAQEGEVLGSIEHPNVVRLHDAGVDGDSVWLLLELVRGENLTRALASQRDVPRLEAVVRWVHLACEGVAAAHAVGVVHRDLKPENILVAPLDVVKVIDFGVAKIHGWGVKTTGQGMLGTCLYMSPEQIHNQPADPHMDVYAIGMILLEAVAGAHPCGPHPNVSEMVRWHLLTMPPLLRTLAPEAPPDLEALIAQALEKDPARRPASMRVLSDALQQVLTRILAPRRRIARNLPAWNNSPGHEVTMPLRATPSLPLRRPPAGAGATIPMEAVPDHRDAAMPPQQPIASGELYRTPEPVSRARPFAPTVPLTAHPPEPLDRRTTSTPVASQAVPLVAVRTGRRWLPLAILGVTVAGGTVAAAAYGISFARSPAAPSSALQASATAPPVARSARPPPSSAVPSAPAAPPSASVAGPVTAPLRPGAPRRPPAPTPRFW